MKYLKLFKESLNFKSIGLYEFEDIISMDEYTDNCFEFVKNLDDFEKNEISRLNSLYNFEIMNVRNKHIISLFVDIKECRLPRNKFCIMTIYKFNDSWFYVRFRNVLIGSSLKRIGDEIDLIVLGKKEFKIENLYYKCDQFDGLIDLLNTIENDIEATTNYLKNINI